MKFHHGYSAILKKNWHMLEKYTILPLQNPSDAHAHQCNKLTAIPDIGSLV